MKKVFLLVLIVLLVTGCIIVDNSISVTGVDLNDSDISIPVGSTYQLTAVITPDNATNKSCTWTTNDNTIVTVSDSGLLTAVAVGQTIVTVKTQDGNFDASVIISVITATTKVALITDSNGIDDESFNQGTWEGILRAEELFDISIHYEIPGGTEKSDYLAEISALYSENYNLIITPGFRFETAIYDAQSTYTDVSFVLIDGIPHPGDYSSFVEDNTVSIFFAEHEAGFIAGVATALQLETASAGFIGGMEITPVQKFNWGFQQGLHYANQNLGTSITMLSENIIYQGTFYDDVAGRELAAQMYDSGVDVIFSAAGGVGIGVIEEAKTRAQSSETVWVVGVDVDQYSLGIYEGDNSVIITSAVKKVDVAAYDMIERYIEETFPGGEVLTYNTENDGVGIPEYNPNLDTDVINTVNGVIAQIISGSIEVSADEFSINS